MRQLQHLGKKGAIVVPMMAYVYHQICANVLKDGAAMIAVLPCVKQKQLHCLGSSLWQVMKDRLVFLKKIRVEWPASAVCTMLDKEECAHFQISAVATVKDRMISSYVERLEANIVKPLSAILFFANEASVLQMKYLGRAIATWVTKVLLM